MQTARVTYLTNAAQKAALEAFAKARGESVGSVVREATSTYMAEADMNEDERFKLLRKAEQSYLFVKKKLTSLRSSQSD